MMFITIYETRELVNYVMVLGVCEIQNTHRSRFTSFAHLLRERPFPIRQPSGFPYFQLFIHSIL